jgi:hypothetical protein
MAKRKKCIECLKTKPIEAFQKHNLSGNPLSKCKPCILAKIVAWREENKARVLAYSKTYRQKNPEKVRAACRATYHRYPDRNVYKRLRHDFGMTPDAYHGLLEQQNHKCAICGIDEKHLKRRLAVDHCHNTGKIRNLLCDMCNRGIGFFFESPEFLRSAAAYIEKWRQDG